MWIPIFFVGLFIVLVKGAKNPIWWAMGAGYTYFAIPQIEFRAPGAPYQAGLFGLAMLGSLAYYKMFAKWGSEELGELATKVARAAVDLVRAEMKEALVGAAALGKLPGEIRRAAVEKVEAAAAEHVDKNAPAAIAVPTRRAVVAAIAKAADEGEQEALQVIALGAGRPTGALRAAIEARVAPKLDASLDAAIPVLVGANVKETIEKDEANKDVKRDQSTGPLGIPLPKGPLAGLISNPGLYLHIAFIFLTWWGAKNALYNKDIAYPRVMVTQLLMIPMIGIIMSVRTPQHFRLFTIAWMFGTWHLCMNGVTYWLQYGGRADNNGGQGGEANFLGGIIVTVAPIAFSMAINYKTTLEKLLGLGAAGCYVLGVLASGSRAGLVALIVGMGFWLLHTNRRGFAIGLSMFAVGGFLVIAPADFWEKMGTIMGTKDKNPWVQTSVEPSKHERIVLWALAIDIWKRHPVMGIGPMNYPDVSATETDFTDAYKGQRGMQAHQTWYQLLAEYGIVGFIVWAGAFFYAMFCYRRARAKMRGFEGWEWFPATCLGLEAGALASAIVLAFNSFQWYDYLYWQMVFGPVTLEIATHTSKRLRWLAPGGVAVAHPPPRYAPPKKRKEGVGIDLAGIDLLDTAPIPKIT